MKRDLSPQEAMAVARLIIKGGEPERDMPDILIRLEGVVALVLLYAMNLDAAKAAAMLNEGLVPGVEQRIAAGVANRAGKVKP